MNPAEAITNNVLGTRHVVQAAQAVGVERLVMISTDKAANPTSVMGASKCAAELIVHDAVRASGRPFMAMRFGNVLGSRGSVVLTFQRQIAAGGPVTVTDPEMKRFFMTIPEAVQLVLQAAVLGQTGEVFLLDMCYERTRHEKIFIAGNASSFVPDHLDDAIDSLKRAADLNDRDAILRCEITCYLATPRLNDDRRTCWRTGRTY